MSFLKNIFHTLGHPSNGATDRQASPPYRDGVIRTRMKGDVGLEDEQSTDRRKRREKDWKDKRGTKDATDIFHYFGFQRFT